MYAQQHESHLKASPITQSHQRCRASQQSIAITGGSCHFGIPAEPTPATSHQGHHEKKSWGRGVNPQPSKARPQPSPTTPSTAERAKNASTDKTGHWLRLSLRTLTGNMRKKGVVSPRREGGGSAQPKGRPVVAPHTLQHPNYCTVHS